MKAINILIIALIAIFGLILIGCEKTDGKLELKEPRKELLIRPLNSFKRHILHTDLGSKKQRALDYSAASTYDHRQRHVISPWYAPELSNR